MSISSEIIFRISVYFLRNLDFQICIEVNGIFLVSLKFCSISNYSPFSQILFIIASSFFFDQLSIRFVHFPHFLKEPLLHLLLHSTICILSISLVSTPHSYLNLILSNIVLFLLIEVHALVWIFWHWIYRLFENVFFSSYSWMYSKLTIIFFWLSTILFFWFVGKSNVNLIVSLRLICLYFLLCI